MKKSVRMRKAVLAGMVLMLLFSACFEFESVEHSTCTLTNSSFIADVSILITDQDGNYYYPYFGIKLPEGWIVEDSIVMVDMTFYPLFADTLATFVHADSLVAKMDSIDPPAEGYYWWVGCGIDTMEYQLNQYGSPYTLFPEIHTDDQTGDFYLDYMAGSNSTEGWGGINWARYDSVPISVNIPDTIWVTSTANTGPGSLPDALETIGSCGIVGFNLSAEDTICLSEELVINHGIHIMGQEENPTIISGSDQSGIFHVSDNANVRFQNLVLIHGNCENGGAIYLGEEAIAEVDGVTIKDNKAVQSGGGIYCGTNAKLILSKTTVSTNRACKGGGICLGSFASMETDPVNRCNVFHNLAEYGNDIFGYNQSKIYLDTCTLVEPNSAIASSANSMDFDILHGKNQLINADAFVSPDGDNDNTGMSPDSPLKNIDLATALITGNAADPATVWLSEGTYSPSGTGEIFPLNLDDKVNLMGTSKELTICSPEGNNGIFLNHDNHMENVTFTGAASAIIIQNGSPVIQNVRVTKSSAGGVRASTSSPLFRNTILDNNSNSTDGGAFYFTTSFPKLINVLIIDNQADRGGGIYCNPAVIDIINSTLTGNSSGNFGGSGIYGGSNSIISLTNSIVYDNYPEEVFLQGIYSTGTINVLHSTIRGGEEGIQATDPWIINWLEGNLNLAPIFVGFGDNPYALSESSPCIEAGTPDTSGLALPCWDLLDNKRCWDGDGDGDTIVDMGTYEFGALAVGLDRPVVQGLRFKVQGYPNPTSGEYSICFTLDQPQKVTWQVFDVRGMMVDEWAERELPAGEHELSWDAAGVKEGIYFCRVQIGDELIVKKLVKASGN
jgi:predicted outer membrane repeat protein